MTACTLEVGGRELGTFDCAEGQSLLDAAAKAGWELPYSCRRGSCETCRVTVLSGETDPPANGGTVLACQARATVPLRIAADRAEAAQPAARRRVRARLYRQRMAAPDVAVVDLRFPAGVRVPFQAGQYLQVLLEGHAPRSFSMANTPKANDGVQLHVRVQPGSLFGGQVLPTLAPGSEVELELPFGDFRLREGDAPVLLVAGGTGFAPMQSLLEDALPRHPQRRFTLYWGARHADGLYAMEQIARWQRRHPHFQFVGVISGEAATTDLRQGLVHEAVLADHASLAGHDVYVCGAPAMVAAARAAFIGERGLPPGRFFADSFVPVHG